MNPFRQALDTASAELRHIARDRRTVLSTQLYALLGPVMLVATVAAVTGEPDRDPRLGVVGGEAAPELMSALRSSGLEVETLPRAPLHPGALEDREAVLVVPGDLIGRRARREKAVLTLHLRQGADADRAERRVASVVSAWSSRIANAELVLRGVAPNLVHPFSLQPVYVDSQSSPQRLASFFLLYVLLAPFLAGVGAATDSATAERERGTLQLMRLQPLIPWAWVFGKMLVVALFCWVGTAISIVVSLLALEALSPAAAEGWRFSADSISILLVAVTPMTLLASALLFAVALQARNTMEAQTRLTLTSVLPIAVGFWIIMAGPDVSSWSFLPFVHELDGLTRWMVGAAFPWTSAVLHFGLCAAGFVTVMVWGAQRIVSEDYLGSG